MTMVAIVRRSVVLLLALAMVADTINSAEAGDTETKELEKRKPSPAAQLRLMRVEGDRLSFASFGSTSHAVRRAEPTADGSLFLVPGGGYSAHLAPIPVEELKDSRVSATIDPRYFTADTAVAAISVRDKAGNEILHAFEVAVEKGD